MAAPERVTRFFRLLRRACRLRCPFCGHGKLFRTWVRMQEIHESVGIVEQCLSRLTTDHKRSRDFDPQAMVPKKIRPVSQDFYIRGETPKGELGFFFRADGKSDVPFRCKCRSCSFVNLSVLPEIAKGVLLADLIAIVGTIDVVMGEVDR